MNKKFTRTTVSALAIILAFGTTATWGNSENAPVPSKSSLISCFDATEAIPLSASVPTADNAIKMGMETASVVSASGAPTSVGSMPVASEKVVHKNNKVTLDASNTADGYVMVAFTGSTTKPLVVIINGPNSSKYTYKLSSNGSYEVFPLSDSNGNYTVTVCENVTGTKYAQLLSQSLTVTLSNEFAPFLRPNQYVNFSNAPATIAKAQELVANKNTDIKKITAVYTYVVDTMTYDKQKAQTVQSGYIPVLDTILAQQKGICFDYASLMTAMLRSQGIPCKLVIGYAGTVYHAWISVYTKEHGWVEQAVLFDGKTWKLMDPTFASSSKNDPEVLKYIGNGSNYSAKYLY